MSKPERGTKRQCLKCGTKYYDLNKDPIVCPSCGAPFVAAVTATEKVRSKAKPAAPVEDETDEVEVDVAAAEVGAEVVSLEEAEAKVKPVASSDDDDDDDESDEVIPGLDDDDDDVEDIGGEVDNSFIEDDDEDDNKIDFDVSRDDDD